MHLHTGCSHWVRCAPWSERRFGSTHCASQGFDAPGLRGGGRCRWRGGAGRRLHSPIRTPSHAHRLPFPPWRTLHAPSGGSSTMLAARSPPPSPSQRHPTGAFVLMQPPPRVPPPPPRMIAVSPPPLLEFPPPAPPSIYLCAIYIPVFPLRYQRDLSRLSALLADYTGTVQKSKKALEKHSLQLARSS